MLMICRKLAIDVNYKKQENIEIYNNMRKDINDIFINNNVNDYLIKFKKYEDS